MKNNRKGFTMAELLIVVAIIAVLVAVAIPVFNTQLEKSRDAVTVSNLRNAYAEAMVEMLDSDKANPTSTAKDVEIKGKTNITNDGGSKNGINFDELPFEVNDSNLQQILDGGFQNSVKVTFTKSSDSVVYAAQSSTSDTNP